MAEKCGWCGCRLLDVLRHRCPHDDVPQAEAERVADEALGPPRVQPGTPAYRDATAQLAAGLGDPFLERLLELMGPGPHAGPHGPTLPPEMSEARGAAAWRAYRDGSPRWDDDPQAWHEGFNAAADADDVRPYGSPC